MRRLRLLLAVLAVASLVAVPAASEVWLNARMIAYSQHLFSEVAADEVGAYPFLPSSVQPDSRPAFVTWAASSPAFSWRLLRLMVAAGDFPAAVQLSEGLPDAYPDRGLPQYDVLLAQAIAAPNLAYGQLAQRPELLAAPARVRDSIVAGMYKFVAPRAYTDPFWELVLLLRPHDLAAALAVWTATPEVGDVHSRLTRFPKDAVLPADKRLYPSIYAAAPSLYASGFWTKQQVFVIMGQLLEDCVDPAAARQMLDILRQREPKGNEWEELAGRLASCEKDTPLAIANSGSTDDVSRLALDLRILGERFGGTTVTLGDNLIANGDFAELSLPAMTPQWWRWACPQFSKGEEGLFVAERPRGVKNSGIAILGLWRDAERPGVCGFYHATQYADQLRPLSLEPNTQYLLAFDYRTEQLADNEAGIYIEAKPSVMYQSGLPLPETNGCWHRFYLLGENALNSAAAIQLFFYSGGSNGGVGRVEFNNVRLSSVAQGPNIPVGASHRIYSTPLCSDDNG